MTQFLKKPSFWLVVIILVESFYFADLAVRYSYTSEHLQNSKADVKMLATFIPRDLTQDKLLEHSETYLPSISPHIYKSNITLRGIKFIFNDKDELIRVNYGLAQNSPIYEKSKP